MRGSGKDIAQLRRLGTRNKILARLHNKDAVSGSLAQAAGDDATGGAAADDNIVEPFTLNPAHCVTPVFATINSRTDLYSIQIRLSR